jgi:hypothetical protein
LRPTRIIPHSVTIATKPRLYASPIEPTNWWLDRLAATIDPPIIHQGSRSPARK